MEKAYAAVSQEKIILVKTVSTTELAAIVNWLVVYAGIPIIQGMGEFTIRDLFAKNADIMGVAIRRVKIELDYDQ